MKHAQYGVLVAHHLKGPHIDYAGLTPFMVLGGGALIVLLVGLVRGAVVRERVVPLLSLITLGGAIGTEIWRFNHAATIIAGALRIDDLAILIDLICAVSAFATVLMAWRSVAPREAGQGEFFSLLLFSVAGMAILASSQDIITLFVGLELLSIPLYILCAAEHRREGSLESGLKYLVIGSVGSATLVYGLALVFGATGQTGFTEIASHLTSNTFSGGPLLDDSLLLTGLALVIVGFAFKSSVAPFHQWTPDVYEGAPTPVTAFMATATKAAALAVFLRFFDVAAVSAQDKWQPAIATIAAITIIVGNVGALSQTSMKRMLGYSGVAQAGYMLAGVVVGTRLGISATVLYLGAYLAMNMAAFAVIHVQERESGDDNLRSLAGLGSRRPLLAWPLTIGMLALAGVPGTVGFVGKFQLIHALVDGDYVWLAIVLVIGAMISLGYYLRVVATLWMSAPAPEAPRPRGILFAPIAGGSPEADGEDEPFPPDLHEGRESPAEARRPFEEGGPSAGRGGNARGDRGAILAGIPHPEVVFVGVIAAAACIVFGVMPSPMFHLASHAGAALVSLF
jgi:NADH-quinone oxidoreductase subunit N